MAYLKNSAVNLLNLHYGLHALALNGAGAFFAVFLLKSGVSVPAVFAAIALVLAKPSSNSDETNERVILTPVSDVGVGAYRRNGVELAPVRAEWTNSIQVGLLIP